MTEISPFSLQWYSSVWFVSVCIFFTFLFGTLNNKPYRYPFTWGINQSLTIFQFYLILPFGPQNLYSAAMFLLVVCRLLSNSSCRVCVINSPHKTTGNAGRLLSCLIVTVSSSRYTVMYFYDVRRLHQRGHVHSVASPLLGTCVMYGWITPVLAGKGLFLSANIYEYVIV